MVHAYSNVHFGGAISRARRSLKVRARHRDAARAFADLRGRRRGVAQSGRVAERAGFDARQVPGRRSALRGVSDAGCGGIDNRNLV